MRAIADGRAADSERIKSKSKAQASAEHQQLILRTSASTTSKVLRTTSKVRVGGRKTKSPVACSCRKQPSPREFRYMNAPLNQNATRAGDISR